MLVYEHDRTEDIVSRLIAVANGIRSWVIVTSILSTGILLGAVGALIFSSDSPAGGGIVGFIVGGILGYVSGRNIARMATVMIEWVAQVLVAQGEIVAALKERS